MISADNHPVTLFNYRGHRAYDFPFDVVEENREKFTADFMAWLPSNLHIFSEFVAQARYVKTVMRRDHYSARTIGEWLRHNSELREAGNGYKLNNDMFPGLARLAMLAYPDLGGLFETRERT